MATVSLFMIDKDYKSFLHGFHLLERRIRKGIRTSMKFCDDDLQLEDYHALLTLLDDRFSEIYDGVIFCTPSELNLHRLRINEESDYVYKYAFRDINIWVTIYDNYDKKFMSIEYVPDDTNHFIVKEVLNLYAASLQGLVNLNKLYFCNDRGPMKVLGYIRDFIAK